MVLAVILKGCILETAVETSSFIIYYLRAFALSYVFYYSGMDARAYIFAKEGDDWISLIILVRDLKCVDQGTEVGSNISIADFVLIAYDTNFSYLFSSLLLFMAKEKVFLL